jgi:glycosyltransferase involved in cell wall biosynthesis
MVVEPKVSILMNCYNGEEYLREAIDSVLAQTYKNWELIFWDNCSTDRSAEIFKSYADERLIYYLSPEHTDLGGGRARAWEYLTGDLIAVLDADDVWLPTKLEKQIPLFDDPDVGIVISDTLFFNEKAERPLYGNRYPPTGWVFERLMAGYYVSLETVVIRRAAAIRLPRAFDPDFSAIADFDLIVRLSRISKLALVPEILAKWRIHRNSDTWRYPLAFSKETERWIEKQSLEDPYHLGSFSAVVAVLKNKNIRTQVKHMILQGRRIDAANLLRSSQFDHWHAWVLLLVCYLPLPRVLLRYVLNTRTEV